MLQFRKVVGHSATTEAMSCFRRDPKRYLSDNPTAPMTAIETLAS